MAPAPLALDILLLPGPGLRNRALALNAELVAAGASRIAFGLHATPHVTLAQLFVAPEALEGLRARIFAADLPRRAVALGLETTGLGTAPFAGGHAVGIDLKRGPDLVALHGEVCALAAPFAVPGAAAGVFRASGQPAIHPDTLAYAEGFLASAAGAAWAPHVTVGLASEAQARALCARPFDDLEDPAAGLALYRLGDFGTAAEPLGTLPGA